MSASRSTPNATGCDDPEFSAGFRGGEGHASRRAGMGGGLPGSRPGGDRRHPAGPDGSGDRRASRPHGRARPSRPPQRQLPAPSADRARGDRSGGAAHPAVRARRGRARLCAASEPVDRMILSCFVLGLSVRKVGEALLPILGRPISPSTVSHVAKQLDAVVAAFHARPLKQRYRVLMLDGVVLSRKTGAGAVKRPVLVALGLRPDGKKEVIDFRLAASESAAEWERFLGDLIRRGLTGDGLEMICVDGGTGLIAALQTAY